MEEEIRILTDLLVGWVKSNRLPNFGPATDLIESDIEDLLHAIKSANNGFECSLEVFIVAVEYLLRLHDRTDRIINLRYAIIASVSLATKFLEDYKFDPKFLASACRITVTELAKMEGEFLNTLSYRLFVSREQFQTLIEVVENERERSRLARALARAYHPYSCAPDPFAPLAYTNAGSFLHSPPSEYHQWLASGQYPVAHPPFHASTFSSQPHPIAPPHHPAPCHANWTEPIIESRPLDWSDLIDNSLVDFSSWGGAIFPK